MESVPLLREQERSSNGKIAPFVAMLALAACMCLGVFETSTSTQKLPATSEIETFTGDLRQRCSVHYIEQTLDHFTASHGTYQERYFVCSEHWVQNGPIFFYTGNEGDVEMYLTNTGLMWENAKEFNAMLVFAEHRYFGKSIPFNGTFSKESMRFLSVEQALGDYAILVEHIKKQFNTKDSAVIAFGGSYGGMLAAWFRQKYPYIVDGSIAASAPVLAFDGETPPIDNEAFSRIVTFGATPAAGSAANCVPNVRKAQVVIRAASNSSDGWQQLKSSLRLCYAPTNTEEALSLLDLFTGVYGDLAMGNYPYPSSYIADNLPGYPYRAACEHLAPDFADDASLLQAFRDSAGVLYNATGKVPCYDWNSTTPVEQINFWEYLWCSEMYMPFDQNGVDDFLPVAIHNETSDAESCFKNWGVELRPLWANTVFGGVQGLQYSSNIVFSNGNYDPWSGYGVLHDLSDTLIAVEIDGGAHHLDLMFSNPLDPPSVTKARKIEMKHVRRWIQEKKKHV
ncbi:lysosomal Pro-X carboxypeptidase [Thraustotheca clavata]|uniref:Lysosomal Pro-X carboxypeptidase n=1 Tax=Thraustotheca clavata TaxID=74557 RepID=A0A1W0A2W4_9STRA|nr:lysosomal Pro-X carboxypeptidase [Thraustotheca clavata]